MIIGICQVELFIGHSDSLKAKRQVLRSIIERARGRFNISIAEVANQDKWQQATVGFACVSNETTHVHEVLSKVVRFIETSGEAELVDYSIEVL